MQFNNSKYKNLLKNPWSYITGAVLISILQITTLVITGSPWGISSNLATWGARLYTYLGGSVDKWYYFTSNYVEKTGYKTPFITDPGSLRNVGIIVGALIASLLASQFRIKKIKSLKQVVGSVLGGLLMGYGAIIAFGCNIGALYGGVANLSLSGWVFALFLFLGAIVGSKLLIKFFI